MSFASETKEEIASHIPRSRHDQLAMAATILMMDGKLIQDGNGAMKLSFLSENKRVSSLFFTILAKLSKIKNDVDSIDDQEVRDLLLLLKMSDSEGFQMERVHPLLLQQDCCKKTFLATAFLVAGSVSDPEKAYHLEIVCQKIEMANQVAELMRSFDLDAKIIVRKGHFVVYLKEGEQIVTLLGYMGAPLAYMNYENVRIVKEMRNDINRQVNCETANIGKTVSAAVRQIEDIERIRVRMGLEKLPRSLRDIALVRMDNPDISLKDLGALLEPPVGKSGVNHRLRRIHEIAEQLR